MGNVLKTLRAAGAKKEETQKTFSMRFRRQKRKRIGNVSGNVAGNALKTFGGKTGKKQTQRKRFGNAASQTNVRKQTKNRRFGNALSVS